MKNKKYTQFSYEEKSYLWIDIIFTVCLLFDFYLIYAYIQGKRIENIFYFIILAVVMTAGIIVHLLRFSKRHKIERKIRFLADTNNWIERDGEQITYSPNIRYKRTKEELMISFEIDGSKKSQCYRDLRGVLQDGFNKACLSATEQNGVITYRLVDDSFFDPLQIDEDTDYRQYCTEEQIQLGKELVWKYRFAPHALITGATGRGKTYVMLYFVRCWDSINADIRIIDPKRSDLLKLGNALGLQTACDPNRIAQLLRESEEMMNKRYDELKEIGMDYLTVGLKPCFILFDECLAFFGGSADDKVKKQVKNSLLEVVAKGRQAGYFAILGTNRGDVQYLGGSGVIREQLGLKIILTSNNTSKTAMELTLGSDYKDLRPRFIGKGEGLIYIDGVTDIPRDFKAPRLKNPWVIKV